MDERSAFACTPDEWRQRLEQALALANDSEFGLSGALWTRNRDLAKQLARRMDTGGVFVNQAAAFSDFHGTGGNPAANASYADAAFVANRFRVV
ncbi:aldehyde dehydrogenase family protein, partial [Vulcanococcus sp.]|uniref:aldehyde dehydrogenase family protein n=1 Tax=Vulcanococcus sp. TaxID=2856995 RepID=UPI003C0263C9